MKLNNAQVLEAHKQDGGVRYVVEHRSGSHFEVLKTARSYGGTQDLWEINPIFYGEGDSSKGEGFVPQNKIESILDRLSR